ncbi:MAG: hypothetical protein AAF708_09030 [Deinococcota bacterium]
MLQALVFLLIIICIPLSYAQDGTVTVDLGSDLGTISPYVYGANYGPLSAVPVDMFPELQASGVTFLRFPGGRWGDINNLQPFHIDMYMAIIDLLGATPSIHVRLENGTPEAAAELVRYTNLEQGYNVQHWYIGNEPSLFDDYTVEDLNTQWRAIALAMLEVDPNIILIGPEPHQWNGTLEVNPRDPNGKEWVSEFLKVNGDLVDIVAVHRYPFPENMSNPNTSVADLRQNTLEWDNIIPNLRTLAKDITGRDDLLFAVTEANSHWSSNIGGEATNDSLPNAIWWADALGKLITDGAHIVGFFDLQSSDSRGGWGMMATYHLRPSYYVYQLYQQFGETLLTASSDIAFVSAYAAVRSDNTLTLILTNINDDTKTVTLNLGELSADQLISIHRLDAEHNADLLEGADMPNGADMQVELPSLSATLLTFALP